MLSLTQQLEYPFTTPPKPGEVIEVHPGILWTRLALPLQLNHINIYFIEDGDGWAVINTGIANGASRGAWQALVDGPLSGRRLTRVIVTHFHPDHIGLAGWLAERFDVPLLMTQTTYLSCVHFTLDPGSLGAKAHRDFYHSHGVSAEATELLATREHSYTKMVTALPPTFRRLVADDTIAIGGRQFKILTADGHAPEQAMLYCQDEQLFFGADQILAKISPNVSVWAMDPDGNPLALFLRSLRTLQTMLPPDTLVLPGHQLPFREPGVRCGQLIGHHEERCAAIAAACSNVARTAAEIVPVVFEQALDNHQMGYAINEVLAHIVVREEFGSD
ncbi:MBL fold metallo-hydrolase [Microbacteriaceae bacterium K1510]|nr:MBL fold metallo-hydrolase [Microbacteriaceae bacterium K1510]